MIAAEFGIIDTLDRQKDYSDYAPHKYNCVCIDDELYIENWWPRLAVLPTYFHRMSRPAKGLARYGVTLIPPTTLPAFLDIVQSDVRLGTDAHLQALAAKINEAISNGHFMIHFGV